MSLTDLVRSLNLYRRHLTESQRAYVAAELLKPYEEAAKKRQLATLKQNSDIEKTVKENLPKRIEQDSNIIDITPITPKKKAAQSTDQAAKELNVSGRSVRDAKTVLEKGTEQEKQKVKAGKKAVSSTAKEIRQRGG